MRLIDADALSKKVLSTTLFIKYAEVFQRMINDAPTIEPSGDLISRDKLNECIKRWYEHMGVDTHGVWNKQLAEIVKDMGEDDLDLEFRFFRESIRAIPSAEAESNDLIIKGAKGIKDGLYNIKDGKLFQYKAKGGTVRTYQIIKGGDDE